MMLNAFLPKSEQRYAVAGMAFGVVFSVICLSIDRFFDNKNSLLDDALVAPTSAAVLLMPLVCGMLFYQWGRSRSRLVSELQLRQRTETQLIMAVHHDRLTGLSNRFCAGARHPLFVAAGRHRRRSWRAVAARSRPLQVRQ
ncbi:hypothetical protein P6U16_19525 [Rhizobium sp. 32-5/1]|uniref:hypothetical protein n=1 Tax=Rhizobium sp. 32-5/1 TaxID=3019602 RepID=UPI00240E8373|nr:hypothetical protein [Rhizobium sp. 32-5/1]WEZ83070.1 hypothetical protein P6U16_19525 [Rhizobium sp. 32-5/1]